MPYTIPTYLSTYMPNYVPTYQSILSTYLSNSTCIEIGLHRLRYERLHLRLSNSSSLSDHDCPHELQENCGGLPAMQPFIQHGVWSALCFRLRWKQCR